MTVSKYQVSSKLPDGRIFVIGADTYDEFKGNLEAALGSVDAEGLLTTMAGSLASAPTSIAAAVANLAPLGVTPAPTQTFTPSTAPVARACKHGTMQTRTGAGAKGPWKAYMCPSPKGTPDQCEPQWIRRNDPEWNSF